MKRMICLLLTLCLLAACAPVIAENPELTEGERKALETLSESLEKDAVRQIELPGEVRPAGTGRRNSGQITGSVGHLLDLRYVGGL